MASTREYIQLRQYPPVLVPAIALALTALAFELIGTALRRQGGTASQ